MAQVKWQKRAERELYRYLVRGFVEFGDATANKFAERVGYISQEMFDAEVKNLIKGTPF